MHRGEKERRAETVEASAYDGLSSIQRVRAQTLLIKTLQKETSNPGAPFLNAQASCGTSVTFKFKGTFFKTPRKLSPQFSFSKRPYRIPSRGFPLCSGTTWPGIERST